MKASTLQVVAAAMSLVEVATAQCAPLHLIAARGSTEQQSSNNGIGVLAVITNGVIDRVPGADAIGIVYPATLNSYADSVAAGDAAMTQAIIDYSTKCPNSKIGLLGYSQGGQVVGDALCGNSENGFKQTSALPAQYASNIVAVVSAADPARTQGQLGVSELGNATLFGGFPRQNTTSCAAYEGRYGLWCNADDLFCAAGKSIQVHLSIISAYKPDMIEYIVSRYYKAVGQPEPSASSSASSAASTSAIPTVSTAALSSFGASATATASYSNGTLTTSTVYTTTVHTVTSCAATVTNCPAHSTVVITETVPLYTTVCPVTPTAPTTSKAAVPTTSKVVVPPVSTLVVPPVSTVVVPPVSSVVVPPVSSIVVPPVSSVVVPPVSSVVVPPVSSVVVTTSVPYANTTIVVPTLTLPPVTGVTSPAVSATPTRAVPAGAAQVGAARVFAGAGAAVAFAAAFL